MSQCAAVADYNEFGVASIITQPGEPGDSDVTVFFLLSNGAGLTHATAFNLVLMCP